MIGDGEGGAHVCVCGIDKIQAGIIHDEAARIVRLTPGLEEEIVVVSHKKELRHPSTDSVFEALSADVEQKEGLN